MLKKMIEDLTAKKILSGPVPSLGDAKFFDKGVFVPANKRVRKMDRKREKKFNRVGTEFLFGRAKWLSQGPY